MPRTHFICQKRVLMLRRYGALPLLALLLISSLSAAAQTKRNSKGRSQRQSSSSASSNRSWKLKQQRTAQSRRQAEALAALRDAADAAPQIEDRFQQAQMLATIAELTYKFDEANARALLMRAWMVAVTADRETQKETQESASSTSQDDPAQAETSEARDAVLLVAARCDERLANKFLRERTAEVEQFSSENTAEQQPTAPSISNSHRSPWGELSFAAQNRLRLARTLLEQVDARSASVAAAPVMREGITAETIGFLTRLRRADATIADKLYFELLAAQQQRIAVTHANDILIAAAYITSPSLFVVVDSNGGLQMRHVQVIPQVVTTSALRAPFSAEARRALGNLASTVLLRPQAAIADATNSAASNETAQLYFALERLLPFFTAEQSGVLASLRARRNELAATLETARRERLERASEERAEEKRHAGDPLRLSREQLRTLPEGAARDAVRLRLVRTASRHLRWADARLAASAITDTTLKSQADLTIRVAQITHLSSSYSAETADDYVRAARFVAESDVPPVWQAWGYAQAAELAFRRGKNQAAGALLDEAVTRANRIFANTDERIAAFILITMTAREVAPARVPALLAEVVRAVNAHDDFSGESVISESIPEANKDTLDDDDSPTASFALDDLFAAIAKRDFDVALAEARNIVKPLPRTLALLGAARAALAADKLR